MRAGPTLLIKMPHSLLDGFKNYDLVSALFIVSKSEMNIRVWLRVCYVLMMGASGNPSSTSPGLVLHIIYASLDLENHFEIRD